MYTHNAITNTIILCRYTIIIKIQNKNENENIQIIKYLPIIYNTAKIYCFLFYIL